jgi:antitoxin VapB
MTTAEVIDIRGAQAVKLPDEFRFEGDRVSIRREGKAVILEPVPPATWPEGFFDRIRIDDPNFVRPDQGLTPPAPTLD